MNNVEGVVRLVMEMHDLADQVVIVDSSDKENLEKLKKQVRSKGLFKVEIFHALALGYVEPLRMYGLSKCAHDWVLYLDDDERISEELRRDLHDIIGRAKASAFAIKRFEHVTARGQKPSFYTWNIRLLNKRFVRYRGILHEQPSIVSGRLERLHGDYCLYHMVEYKGRIGVEYLKAEQLDRFSYRLFNERLLDYASKVIMPDSRSIKGKTAGRIILGILSAYERMGMKAQDAEVSDFDYANLFMVRDLVLSAKRRSLKIAIDVLKERRQNLDRIKALKSMPESGEMFEISKIILEKGVIQFLGLDSEKTVERLTRKYARSKQGLTLLTRLLMNRYEGKSL